MIPFQNEERHLAGLLESLDGQTRPFDAMLLVDDGSTDRSADVAAEYARSRPDVELMQRPHRAPGRDRLARAAVAVAFQWAVDQMEDPWDVLAKIDADIRLTPRTVGAIEHALRDDPLLGCVGPYVSEPDASGRLRRLYVRPEQVTGGAKFYRRQCWEEISPLLPIMSWDVLDVYRARVRGWRTASIEPPDGDPVHARPMGAHDGRLRAYRRWGLGTYQLGEHPVHTLLRGARHLRDEPPVLGAANFLLGASMGALRRAPRAEPEVRAYIREDQIRRIRGRLSRGVSAASARGRAVMRAE